MNSTHYAHSQLLYTHKVEKEIYDSESINAKIERIATHQYWLILVCEYFTCQTWNSIRLFRTKAFHLSASSSRCSRPRLDIAVVSYGKHLSLVIHTNHNITSKEIFNGCSQNTIHRWNENKKIKQNQTKIKVTGIQFEGIL